MIYFDSKYLSEHLKINQAKWKRWAREFLPPDPLGGFQSGFARQFSYKDAFRVFIGGHLVSGLKFTIPEARRILDDLEAWIRKQDFYGMPIEKQATGSQADHIYIYNTPNGKLRYAIRTVVDRRQDADDIHSEHYGLTTIGASTDMLVDTRIVHARVLLIRSLYRLFLEAVIQK